MSRPCLKPLTPAIQTSSHLVSLPLAHTTLFNPSQPLSPRLSISRPIDHTCSSSSDLASPDVKQSTETSTSDTSPLTNTSSSPTAIRNPFTIITLFVNNVAKPKGKKSMVDDEVDEEEKDDQGRVKQAATEPCEKCGGRIVFATKGE
jgi:hypothetical protein